MHSNLININTIAQHKFTSLALSTASNDFKVFQPLRSLLPPLHHWYIKFVSVFDICSSSLQLSLESSVSICLSFRMLEENRHQPQHHPFLLLAYHHCSIARLLPETLKNHRYILICPFLFRCTHTCKQYHIRGIFFLFMTKNIFISHSLYLFSSYV